MAKKVEIIDLDINVNALISKMSQTRSEIEKLKASQKTLAEQGQQNSDAFSKNEVELKRLQTAYGQQKNVVQQLTDGNNKFATATQAITSAINTEITSITSARNNNTQLLKLRNELNLSTAEGQQKLTEINAKLNENNQFIKANVSEYEQQKIAIGDYKNQIKEAFNEINIFNGGIGGFIQRSQEAGGVGNLLTTSLKSMATGIGGVTKASLTFLATPIGAVIGAIGLVLAGLITYLKSTQSGIDKITAVTRPLQAIMESLFRVLQNVGKALFDAFSNPKKTLSDLADFVKQNLINRFTAFKVILDGIINLDFKKVTNGVLQAGTGVENMTDKIANASKQTKEFLDEAIKKGQELDRLEKELIQTRIKNKTAIGELQEALKAQNRIAEDQTKPLAEREAAANRTVEISKEINALKQKELDLEIAILKNKQDRNDTSNEEKLQLAELIAKKNEANAAQLELETTQNNKLIAIRKEAQSKAIQAENERINKMLQTNKEEIDLFIALQGNKKKELDDQLAFEQALSDKRLALLDKEYKAGRISKTAYETEKLNITNEFAQKQADMLLNNAQVELDIYKQSIDKKLADESFLTQAKLEEFTNYNNQLAEREREIQALKLEQGVINQTEYNTAIDTINEENRIKNEELEAERKVAEQEQQIADLELKREQDQLLFEEQLAIDLERNEIAKQQELANAEKTGADKELITKKYADNEKRIRQAVELAKVDLIANGLSQAKGIFKENSLAYKAIAIAEATMNTYKAASLALSTYAYPVGGIFAGLAIGQGLLQVSKIAGVQFAEGGQVPEIPTLSAGLINNGANLSKPLKSGDDTLAYVAQGEVILNKAQQRKAGGASFFRSIGVPGFASGGINGGYSNLGSQGGTKIDFDLLAEKISNANQNMPAPVVAVTDINRTQNSVRIIEEGANF